MGEFVGGFMNCFIFFWGGGAMGRFMSEFVGKSTGDA